MSAKDLHSLMSEFNRCSDEWKLILNVYDKNDPKRLLWEEVLCSSEPFSHRCHRLTEIEELYPKAAVTAIKKEGDCIAVVGKTQVVM